MAFALCTTTQLPLRRSSLATRMAAGSPWHLISLGFVRNDDGSWCFWAHLERSRQKPPISRDPARARTLFDISGPCPYHLSGNASTGALPFLRFIPFIPFVVACQN